MNYKEALKYIHSIPKFRRPLGNANLSRLLKALENPQQKLKFIHIAGTNGKGSTAAMLGEILARSGYRTGLFTSPFIEVFNERIRINGEYISDSNLAMYAERVKTAMEKSNSPVSEFAFITAMAFLYFCECKCDIVVLEVGMGGALDATNVIEDSLISIICSIGLDHTQYLGNTIEEIAREKCGIIKENGYVVSYPKGIAADIIQKTAQKRNARLVFAEKTEKTDDGFKYKGRKYALSLKGEFQPQNAAVVLEAVEALRHLGFDVSENSVRDGLINTKWAARFEFISDNVIIDGGHNPDGMRALRRSLTALGRDIILVVAMMADKDYESCIREIAPAAKAVVATELNMPRCLRAQAVADIIRSMNIPVTVNTDPHGALDAAMRFSGDNIICVCGSLYLAGEVRKKICKNKK